MNAAKPLALSEPSLFKPLLISVLGHGLLLVLFVCFQQITPNKPTATGVKAMEAYLASTPTHPAPSEEALSAQTPTVEQAESAPAEKQLLKAAPPSKPPIEKTPIKPDDMVIKKKPALANQPPAKADVPEKANQDKAKSKETPKEKPKEKPEPKHATSRADELKALALEAEKSQAVQAAKARDDRQRLDAERAQKARASDLNASLSREEARDGALASGALGRYASLLQARFEHNWIKPASAQKGLRCEVKVTQVPGGTVTMVKIGVCNGDASVEQSIVDAVYRSSPLPPPEDMNVFERQFTVIFAPDH
jgi:colicin import membrane protein